MFIHSSALYLKNSISNLCFMKKTVLLLSFLTLLVACNQSKVLVKKGKELETHGMHYEAVDFYLKALNKNPDDVEARIEAKKTGQRVLDDLMADFYMAYTSSSNKQAVYSYLEAKKFYNLLANYKIKLEFPFNYDDYFTEVKELYLKSLYEEALNNLESENFTKAKEKLNEIEKLDPEYEKAAEFRLFAKIEPEYRKGIDLFDAEKYRPAHKQFLKVKDIDPGYKEVDYYIEQCLKLGVFTIGLTDFSNFTSVKGLEEAIATAFVNDMLDSRDPFIKIIDRSSVDVIFKEQKLGMDERIDPESVAEAGKILGAKALVLGSLIVADEREGQILNNRRKGYVGRPVKRKNPKTGKVYTDMTYNKVYYREYYRKNEVNYTFNYKIVSTETGEIIFSDNIEVNEEDVVNYVNYNGNTRYLYAGTWDILNSASKNDQLFNSFRQKRQLDQKITARREIQSIASLRQSAIEKIANRMAIAILKYQD